jgi:NTP pyrophosphatase (non-canonical NTP hydrolase)
MDIKHAQLEVDKWIKSIGVRYFSELTNMVILTEEVGELARLFARVYGEQSFKHEADERQSQERIGEEMADILFVLICLANQTGVDLSQAFEQSMIKRNLRDKKRHSNNPKLRD